MAPTKGGGWLVPSFDCEPVKKSTTTKREAAKILESKPKKVLSEYNIIPQRSAVNSLSALIAACEPQKPNELVVSRQKQQEIIEWFQYRAVKGRPSILVVSGPSGCGKTEAVKVLAKENDFSVMEWITPIDQAIDENNRAMRQGDRFEDYLVRATRYNSVLSNHTRRLLLVKDIPNVYLLDNQGFHSVLQQYLEVGREPLVFVCTETGNSRILQTLFAPNVRQKFSIDLITVNSVTQSAMKNALKRISQILNMRANHILQVTQEKVDEILSNNIGDIRSAILNLIFISLKVPGRQMTSECGSREESLGLLHGIGRVINPKRVTVDDSWKFVHDPDEIAAFFQSQATIFLHFLQENYLNTMRGIEEVNISADILSLSETLSFEWRDPNLNKLTLSLCTRGIMVINEKPVSGWNPVRSPQNYHVQVRRDLASAELRWYESIIKPQSKSKEELCDVEDIEDVIE